MEQTTNRYSPNVEYYPYLHFTHTIYTCFIHYIYMEAYTQINQKRVKLLKKLKLGEKTIKNLYWDIPCSWHSCYHHLKVLKKIGLVKTVEKETTTLYGLTDKGHDALQHYE